VIITASILIACGVALTSHAADIKAGFSKINNTPTEAMGFTGYGGRWSKTPDEPRRFITDLFIRATAVQDKNGKKIVLLSYDQAMPYKEGSRKKGHSEPLFKKGINKVLLDAVAKLRAEAK